MIGRCRKIVIGAALIVAPFMLAPAAAQQQPTAQSDFSCYALLTSQAQAIALNQRIAPAQKAEQQNQALG